tara:strand:- start:160 stop:849 length:690 start_codon:yes stop_codon:yes gene_type:complete
MTKEISQIINGLISDIDNTIEGVWDAINERTNVCKTKWARVGKVVADSVGNEYTITEIEIDEWIKSKAVDPTNLNPLEGVIYLSSPFYISGTKIATNNEWTKSTNNMTTKTPLAWLLEIIRVRKYGRGNTIDFESDIRLFFLDETDIRNYYTKDHRENVVYPMQNLAMEFIEIIQKNRQFATLDEWELITFSRFGVERDNGMFQNILDANLSGVELRVNLTKYKENCVC